MPLRELARHDGYQVTFRRPPAIKGHTDDPALTLQDAEEHDVIIGHRLGDYGGLRAWRRWATDPAKRLVYELDDNVFRITQDNDKGAYDTFSDSVVQAATRGYIRYSALLTVTTDYIAGALLNEAGADIPYAVLPNCIPEYVLDLPRDEKARLRIGWIGGSSHGRDIHTATPSVRRFMQRFPDWDMFVCGVDFTRQFKTPADRTYHVPWVRIMEDPKLYYRSIDYDIGICPLLDTEFARCKSAVKALEYSARGIPVVASDVLPYRNFIRHGETGFLCKYDHEWLKYLSLLARDEDLRVKMGAAAKEEARKWTIENNWHLWAEAYESLF
jgi:glycosyltransferase involved in cell wall biosynthesis